LAAAVDGNFEEHLGPGPGADLMVERSNLRVSVREIGIFPDIRF
jgi:hypothetical protein